MYDILTEGYKQRARELVSDVIIFRNFQPKHLF